MRSSEKEKSRDVLLFIERIEDLSVVIDPVLMAEGFNKALRTLIEGWIKDAKLYYENNKYDKALNLILQNLHKVDFRIDYPTARLALLAAYKFEPLNQTWIQIINELSKNQPIEDTLASVKQQEQPQSINKITKANKATKPEIGDVIFSKNGTVLLHFFKDKVFVWDTKNDKLRYQVFGRLLGVAHKNSTFQTTDGIWDIDTGKKMERPTQLHDWDKRLRVTSGLVKNEFHLKIIDTSKIREPLLIYIGTEGQFAGFTRGKYTVDPNGRYVAVYLYINIMGHDLDQIVCYDLETGQEAYSFADNYEVSFSGVHNLMLAKDGYWSPKLEVHELLTKQKLEFEKLNRKIDERTIRINPKESGFAAAINKKHNVIFLGRINDISSRKEIRKRGVRMLDIDFTPDGGHIAASLSNGEIHIWNVNTCQLAKKLVYEQREVA